MSQWSGNSKGYWAEVTATEERLKVEVNRSVLQLRNGAAYVTSIERMHGIITVGGKISEVTIRDAAKLSVDGSHRLSTDEEIGAYLRDMKTRRSIASATGAASLKTIGLQGSK